ncbi:RIP metalloprotease RseP [Irregularibacter muris]|uniref:Zinc metalloprotease n=1 Tax=Irregularibacter muris TaxID=1796619 RepID=A0AAE3L3E2_9FIRM|nr:RIP metalloprotease RseP [Irregularibacter muris]MCR1898113.1 RIP metalloprotease RseP [Irregularibacter muris]
MSTIIFSLIIFGILVIFHEFGHYSVAKLIGVKVEEFAVGMGPKIFGFKKGETVYSLRALPLGGFCKMLGEDEDSHDVKSLSNQSKLGRAAVFAAGSFMNIILAIILLTIVFYSVGTPTTTIKEVDKEYPAYEAGLRPGDQIVEINGQSIKNYTQIENIITTNKDGQLNVIVNRNSTLEELNIHPKFDKDLARYRIGIVPRSESSIMNAVTSSIHQIIFLTGTMLNYLGQLIIGKGDTSGLVGPVGVVAIVNEAAKSGLLPVIHLAAMISLNLAVFNLLPIPALDGSRLFFLAIEGIRGKPVKPEKEGMFHFVGFVLLMILAVFIGYRDITRFTNLF